MSKKVAVILTGCGYLDGAEINESVLSVLAIEMEGATYEFFSFDREQKQVTSHISEKPLKEQRRNVLEESARIARGKIEVIEKLEPQKFDVLWLPGGYGIATNASNFADQGEGFSVDPELKKRIQEFYQAKKPVVGVCIAPIVIAKSLEGLASIEITLGQNKDLNRALTNMNMEATECRVDQTCMDQNHNIYTTPAYVESDATPAKVFRSLTAIAKQVL